MRLCFALAAFAIVTFALPAVAYAACPGYTAAAALRDKAVDDKVHSSKLKGDKAQAAIANLKSGIASAESCMGTGSTADRAAALGVAAQLRWNQACVLSYDGIPADKKSAIAIVKASDREMDAFSTNHPSLSQDGQILFQNWEHFDDEIETGHPDSCVE
jgi:hypothetical protein